MSGTTLAGLTRRCPWGLAGMVALVVLVEATVGARSMSLYDVDEWAFRWTGRAITRQAKRAEILCFGDSLVKLSVIPSVVGERTGKRVFNLALSGSQATTSYFVLKRALDAGARPEAVVVDFNPPLLRLGPRHILTRWGAMLDPFETAQLAWWAGDSDLFGQVTASHLLPSLRGKSTIRANIMDALANRPVVNPSWNGMALRNWKKNDGAQLMVGSDGVRNVTIADMIKLREGYYPEWKCHRANLEGIDHFLGLAARSNIRVFWLIPALLPAFHDEIGRSGIDAQQEAFIRSWQAKYPNLVVLDARSKVVEFESFWDPQHLSIEGASAFSRALGDILRRSIGGATDQPRWVALPEIRRGPLPPGIEDMNASRVALEDEAAAKLRR